ncbi:MAG: anhydro-N-acetylmuramic acid kinase [Bacteroidetes bacterium GWF2_38_335]|nr:MAG: anhydro-N-acetylmuramic acid kinase [Bacteroidetes bacterium GWF2_38_335]OFY77477.1 MAG: anhydro-N-acetylmuramic acid kinase [Bacteroidetes bacterium RIFOXYA12_FULL_38_20]HBS87231.1 anhydro-N-acetylmuramic acid kinase [Bacteroidales bacterium]
MEKYKVIGVMSGSSLDGLDVALCEFSFENKTWDAKILHAETYSYNNSLIELLQGASELDGFNLLKLHKEYGVYIGKIVNHFIDNCPESPDFIASHGHTIFHQPENQITFQVGSGAFIASTTGITTISDFRTLDVALGGQGAPLVPIGDEFLFNQYDFCLNLGGIANISYKEEGKRKAFDICPVNMVINKLAKSKGKPFDMDGELAKSGKLNTDLLNDLDKLSYYQQKPPKSLGREWVEKEFYPALNRYEISVEDKLNTIYHHIANQIQAVTHSGVRKELFLTGGGSHNKYLVQLIRHLTNHILIIPDDEIVDFKEAMIFAFLGVLRYKREINCLSSVTGARQDCIGGIFHRI